MTDEQRQMINQVWNDMLNVTNSDQKRKDLWDSLDPVYQGIVEAYSKAMASTIICAPDLRDVSGDNPDMPKAITPDITVVPSSEIKLPKVDLKPVKPVVCSVDDLPKHDEAHDAKQRELLEEFNKKHPLPTKEEIKEMEPKMPSKEKLHKLAQAFKKMYEPKYNTTTVDGYDFVCTCHACPEQYNVYKGGYEHGEYVAYVRKRWGHLTVDDKNGNLIYSVNDGETYSGTIENRDKMFKNIVNVLNKTL